MNKFDFFISYSRDSNIYIIEQLINILEKIGFTIWYDKYKVILGENIYIQLDEILNDCQNSNGAILFLDPSYFEKEWCLFELDYLINHNIKLYPIIYSISKNEIPTRYSKLKNLNLCKISDERDINNSIDKIIRKYITNIENSIVNINFKIENNILKTLVYEFKNNVNFNSDYDKLFLCDNISLCIEYSLYNNKFLISEQLKILLSIIHNYKFNCILNDDLNMLKLEIVTKSTELLLKVFNL